MNHEKILLYPWLASGFYPEQVCRACRIYSGCFTQSVDNYPGGLDFFVKFFSASVPVDRTYQYIPGLENYKDRTKHKLFKERN